MDEKTQTRTRIMEAAGKRFMHYGYSKTTMAEIARDLGMSTGNLYRFYESKVDIAQAIASLHDVEADALLNALASKPTPAEERLREMAFRVLRDTFTVMAESQKVFDIAQAITRERPQYANARLAAERVYLRRILEDGVREGAFAPMEDADFTAEMYQSATMKFRYPQLHTQLSLEALERELAGVLDLILIGLRAR